MFRRSGLALAASMPLAGTIVGVGTTSASARDWGGGCRSEDPDMRQLLRVLGDGSTKVEFDLGCAGWTNSDGVIYSADVHVDQPQHVPDGCGSGTA
jgi:hypothetical protein